MKLLKIALPGTILLSGLFVSSQESFAKVEYTKATKKPCITCHVTAKSKELNEVGKCYGEKKTLEGCESKTPEKK